VVIAGDAGELRKAGFEPVRPEIVWLQQPELSKEPICVPLHRQEGQGCKTNLLRLSDRQHVDQIAKTCVRAAVSPRADASAGFRGWARLSRFVGPKLRDWEARWWRARRENASLRSKIGTLITEISRLTDSG
jgi:hypothetical protein